jgi:signal transduction histidine kinase
MTGVTHRGRAGRANRAPVLRGVVSSLIAAVALASLAKARQPVSYPRTDPAAESAARPSILVLFAEDPSQPATQALEDGLATTTFGVGADAPIMYYEYLDAPRFEDRRYDEALKRFLADKYRGRDVDLIVAIAQSAIEFVAATHDDLWPGVPILFAATHAMTIDPAAALPGASGIVFRFDFADALSTVTGILPDTRHVALITGASALEQARTTGIADDVRRAGLDPIALTDLTMEMLLGRVATLPPQTIVFVAGPLVDAAGRATPARTLCQLISSASNSPTFMAAATQFVGCGITGGKMRDFAAMGRLIGQRTLALRSAFTQPGIVTVPAPLFTTLAFDERQLERWHIDERRLPKGSLVSFRRPSLWRDHRLEVASVSAAVLFQSLLIAGLLYERRARRTAEGDSRRSLSLAAHVDRRTAMSELTGSIVHELNQPLASILHNAEAAELLLTSNRGTVPVLLEILRDIRTEDGRASQIAQRHRAMLQKHEMEKRPIDIHAVVRESLALVAHDAEQRRVQIAAVLPSTSCIVAGDQILLQQVVVNLVLNAMDAMAETPPAQRRVTVRSVTRHGVVEIEVVDCGPGIAADVMSRLFDPFVTTKATGLGIGLSIARSTIEALGGTIEARNNADGGATFSFTLPLTGGTT